MYTYRYSLMCPAHLLKVTMKGYHVWTRLEKCLRQLRDVGEHPFKAVDVTAEWNTEGVFKTLSIWDLRPVPQGLDKTK